LAGAEGLLVAELTEAPEDHKNSKKARNTAAFISAQSPVPGPFDAEDWDQAAPIKK
jgi:hypothetical protein